MMPRRLVLLVEGDGDVEAAPILLRRLLDEYQAFDAVFPDPKPLRVGEYSKVIKDNFKDWRRYLQVAAKRRDVGGCLLLLDGDSRTPVEGQAFCAARAARLLAKEARQVGAGSVFSVAIVFACMEFESWLIAGAESLAGRSFADSGRSFPDVFQRTPQNPEIGPRDAKGWLRSQVRPPGYSPARDQAELTRLVDLNLVRQKPMRSFRRLESAVRELVGAVRSGRPIVTPG